MELEVGMYVRTKEGRIFQWNKLCTTSIEDYMEHTRKILFIEDEIKSSSNVIGLIQVGDYVNGYLVTDVYRPDGNKVFRIEIERDTLKGHIIDKSSQIKSIVTKEQFESMSYKVQD